MFTEFDFNTEDALFKENKIDEGNRWVQNAIAKDPHTETINAWASLSTKKNHLDRAMAAPYKNDNNHFLLRMFKGSGMAVLSNKIDQKNYQH